MKTLKILIISVLVFNSYALIAQNLGMNKKVEKIKKSGRDSIIKLALKKMDKTININEYIIQVKANKTSVIVSFHIPIVYLPLNTVYYYNYGIDLIEGTSWSGVISNPHNYGTDQNDIPNYFQTKETQKHIQFVLNAVNKSDEIGSISIEDFSNDDSMIIRDNKGYYEITMLSPHQESFYKVDKQTGKIYDSVHAHSIPPPNFEDENNVYKEIN